MKGVLSISIIIFFIACGKPDDKKTSIEMITETGKQLPIFKNLISITDGIPDNVLQDSLAFLILPVQASCPACRKKAIDSIMKHKDNLLNGHFIIISAGGSKKIINSYFQEQGYKLPVIAGRFFLDSTNQAHRYELCKSNPTLYYTYDRKAYKKISAIPATVKEDLREFFSGYRNDTKN